MGMRVTSFDVNPAIIKTGNPHFYKSSVKTNLIKHMPLIGSDGGYQLLEPALPAKLPEPMPVATPLPGLLEPILTPVLVPGLLEPIPGPAPGAALLPKLLEAGPVAGPAPMLPPLLKPVTGFWVVIAGLPMPEALLLN